MSISNIFVRVCMFWHSFRGCFWQANYSQIQIGVSWSRRAFTICRGQDTVFSAPYLEGLSLTKVFQFPLSKIFYILEYLSVSFPWNLLWMGININLSNKKYWRKPFIIEIYKLSLPPSQHTGPGSSFASAQDSLSLSSLLNICTNKSRIKFN